MISPTAARVAEIVSATVAVAVLAGCGNGVDVRGPASTSPTSGSSTTAAPHATPSAAGPSSGTPTDSPTEPRQSPSTASSPDSGRNDGRNDGGNNAGTNAGTNAGNNGSGNGADNGTDNGTDNGGGDSGSHHNNRGGGRSGNGGDGHQSGSGSGTKGGDQHSGSGAGGHNGSAAPTVATCGLDDLSFGVHVPEGGGAAGSQYVLLTFTNTSDRTCTMRGYAGVSFVGHHNGTQLGHAAVRATTPQGTSTVHLAPGDTESELVQIRSTGPVDPKECQPTTSDGFRVYPPDSYTAAYVPFKTSACQNKSFHQLTVYPVGTKS